ncbi:hypothetical protein pEaSNUABM42_00238 [Erwinia phage pEa_SNUABM_42]|nr:hypothetical protein pEaSNUABM43_00239 [Erwinia phage pEa_SNUABM_43]QVW55555.1 hypothetical protein pEaSNUABM42_00238 [Erwinia phage pEa_SNUABM_42]
MSLNKLSGFSSSLESKASGAIDRVNNVQNAAVNTVNNVQNGVNNAVNRVQDTVDGVERGVQTAQNLYNDTVDKAGKAYDSLTNGASSIKDKLGNLFGGSDLATSNAVKAPGSAESGTSPGSRIAGFSTDPKETLPSINPLNREVAEPFKPKNEAANGVLDYLKPGKAGSLLSQGFSKLTALRDSALGAIGTDYASVKKRIESTMQVAGQLARLPGEVQQEINSYVSAVNQARNEITAVIDGATQTFKSFKDFDDYLAIDSFIESFKGSNSLANFDIGTTSGLIYGLSSKLSEYGLPEKTVSMVDAITDPVAKRAMYGELLVQAASVGNIDTVEFYLTKLEPGQGLELANDVIQKLFGSLQVDTGVGLKSYGTRLLSICNSLDPNWDKTKVAPVRTELLNYTYCNINALQALLTTDKRKYVCAAGSRRLQRADVLVNQFFPAA